MPETNTILYFNCNWKIKIFKKRMTNNMKRCSTLNVIRTLSEFARLPGQKAIKNIKN